MDKDSQIIELRQIYRQMDAAGKKVMIKAAAQLFASQKTLMQKSRTSRFNDIPGYFITGILLLFSAFFFWITLINPALLMLGDTPLIMLRIIVTALFGMFIIGTGFVWFVKRRLPVPLMLLAIGAGILCVDPGLLTDLIGFALIALIAAVMVIRWKREKVAVAA